jgi:ADP-ribose pyrophosphatase YjhB (NUDIX family)
MYNRLHKGHFMKIYYSDSSTPVQVNKSLFLAGPSPRGKEAIDWRIEAVRILEELKFDGEVFIPIPEKKFAGGGDQATWTYLNQIQWECESREIADRVVFWVPRDIKAGMPGFTTNVEFGEDLGKGKVVYGRPDKADKCRYLDQRNEELSNITHNSLKSLLQDTIAQLGEGAQRTNGEVFVPLDIWKTVQFQDWYKNLKLAGNTLVGCKVLNEFRMSNKKLFSFTLHVNIWIESEQRNKTNEFVFFRTSISSVLAYHKQENETYVILVKEFRSPVNNSEGFVYELPGGSNFDGIKALENARQELAEETGISVAQNQRFEFVNERQIAATLCTYVSSLYRVELNEQEFADAKASTQAFGVVGDSERTYVQVVPLSKINEYKVDYSTLGMIYEALHFKS